MDEHHRAPCQRFGDEMSAYHSEEHVFSPGTVRIAAGHAPERIVDAVWGRPPPECLGVGPDAGYVGSQLFYKPEGHVALGVAVGHPTDSALRLAL